MEENIEVLKITAAVFRSTVKIIFGLGAEVIFKDDKSNKNGDLK